MKKITIFHGSDHIIKKPDLKLGNPNNDYGRGFYCTKDLEFAKEWACKNGLDGYANKYEINTQNLNILDLTTNNSNILNWLALLIKNRTFDKNQVTEAISKIILEKYLLDTSQVDIIIGYRADDSYFSYAKAFLSNTLSLANLEHAMKLGNLGTQFVLVSEKAFNQIKFVEALHVEDTYFVKYTERDEKARVAYRKIASNKVINTDDIFAIDIIKKESKQ